MRSHPRRLVGRIAAAAALALAGLAGLHAPAQAAGESYVALGDSYASGVGSRTYYSDSGTCYRSPKAYPVLGAARVGATLTFKACSGAKTTDVTSSQLSPLTSSTRWVTVQAGGNDAGFAGVITTCAAPSWASNCGAAIDKAQTYIRSTLPGRLDTLYAAIRARATTAEVIVVGYPRLFMGEDCNAGTWFSGTEMTRLNQTADLLNQTLAARAAARGYAFVNPTSAYTGHAVCADVEWVNGLSSPIRESYHPNATGQVGYADLVDDHLS